MTTRPDHLYYKRIDAENALAPGEFIFSVNGFTEFRIYESYADVEADIRSRRYVCMAEHIPPDVPVKFYADIETSDETLYSSAKLYIEHLVDYFHERDLEIVLLRAHRADKLSWHIIVPQLVFSNLASLREWIRQRKRDIVHEKFMDKSVYNNNRVFKTVFSTKPGEGAESMMVFATPEEGCDITDISAHFVRNIDPTAKIIHIPPEPQVFTAEIPEISLEIIPPEINAFVARHYGRIVEACELLYNDNGSMTTIKCLLTIDSCPISGRVHRHTFGHRQSVFINRMRAFLACEDRDECSQKYNVIEDGRKLTERIRDILDRLKPSVNISLTEEAKEYLATKYISIFETNPHNIKIKSAESGQIHFSGEAYDHAIDTNGYNAYDKSGRSLMRHGIGIDDPYLSRIVRFGSITINNITNNYYKTSNAFEDIAVDIPPEIYGAEDLTNDMKNILSYRDETSMVDITARERNFVVYFGTWYYYDMTCWIVIPQVVFAEHVIKIITKYLVILRSAKDNIPEDTYKLCIKTLQDIRKSKYHNTICRTAEGMLYRHKFTESLNTIRGLLVYSNTVYDYNTNTYMAHSPEHMNTYTLPFHCNKSADTTPVEAFFAQIFPVRAELDYFLWAVSRARDDRNPNSNIYFFHGNTANSKSTVIKFLSNYFGSYSCAVKTSILTGKDEMDPNSATNWLVSLVGRKFLYTSELNGDDVHTNKRILFNSARIKQLTGGERIACRANYGVETNVEITGHIFISCNYIPQFQGGLDDALQRRVKIITFRSQFVADSSRVDRTKHIYPADRSVSNKIQSEAWLQALDVLLDRYQHIEYMNGPDSVMENLQNQISKHIDDKYEHIFEFLSLAVVYDREGWINRTELYQKVIAQQGLTITPEIFYRDVVPMWIKLNYNTHNLHYESKKFFKNNTWYRGWLGLNWK